MKRLFALMIVMAFTFSMVSFAQDAPKTVKAPKAKIEKKVEVKEAAAKKEVVKEAKATTEKAGKATTEKTTKMKHKKAAKKVEPKTEVK
ncbi:MAG: hypothetical protein WC557_09325 [Ignavibacteriaceae bacterium]